MYFDACKKIGHIVAAEPPPYNDDITGEPITKDGIARYIAELIAEQDLVCDFLSNCCV